MCNVFIYLLWNSLYQNTTMAENIVTLLWRSHIKNTMVCCIITWNESTQCTSFHSDANPFFDDIKGLELCLQEKSTLFVKECYLFSDLQLQELGLSTGISLVILWEYFCKAVKIKLQICNILTYLDLLLIN